MSNAYILHPTSYILHPTSYILEMGGTEKVTFPHAGQQFTPALMKKYDIYSAVLGARPVQQAGYEGGKQAIAPSILTGARTWSEGGVFT